MSRLRRKLDKALGELDKLDEIGDALERVVERKRQRKRDAQLGGIEMVETSPGVFEPSNRKPRRTDGIRDFLGDLGELERAGRRTDIPNAVVEKKR